MGSPPQYQEPPLDPVFGQLLAQSQQQGIEATQQDIGAQAARLAARFGQSPTAPGGGGGGSPATPASPTIFGAPGSVTSADPASLLARYGMQLAGARGGMFGAVAR